MYAARLLHAEHMLHVCHLHACCTHDASISVGPILLVFLDGRSCPACASRSMSRRAISQMSMASTGPGTTGMTQTIRRYLLSPIALSTRACPCVHVWAVPQTRLAQLHSQGRCRACHAAACLMASVAHAAASRPSIDIDHILPRHWLELWHMSVHMSDMSVHMSDMSVHMSMHA